MAKTPVVVGEVQEEVIRQNELANMAELLRLPAYSASYDRAQNQIMLTPLPQAG